MRPTAVSSRARFAGTFSQRLTPERAVEMGRRARALVETGRGAVEQHLKIIATRLSSATFARAVARLAGRFDPAGEPPGIDGTAVTAALRSDAGA